MTVAIDFDGVLNEYHGWVSDRGLTRGPVPGAREFVQRCIDAGFEVVVFTCRDTESVQQWLEANGFPALTVTDHKPIAMVYIDDRGFRFTGDWEAAFDAITQAPWWGRELWTPEAQP